MDTLRGHYPSALRWERSGMYQAPQELWLGQPDRTQGKPLDPPGWMRNNQLARFLWNSPHVFIPPPPQIMPGGRTFLDWGISSDLPNLDVFLRIQADGLLRHLPFLLEPRRPKAQVNPHVITPVRVERQVPGYKATPPAIQGEGWYNLTTNELITDAGTIAASAEDTLVICYNLSRRAYDPALRQVKPP